LNFPYLIYQKHVDGTSLSLRNIRLTYSLSNNYTNKLHIKELSFSGFISNYLIFYKEHSPDPEIFMTIPDPIDYTNWGFGMKITI